MLEQALSRLPWSSADVAFYLAGADPYQKDRLGRLSLTKQGLEARDEKVLSMCRELEIPTVVVMAGGYSENLNDIVDIHSKTTEVACRVFGAEPRLNASLGGQGRASRE